MPLIAFEGIDGSGKSTQIKMLSEFLHVNGIDHIVTREPGGTKLGDMLRTVLLETRVPISIESEILIFLASRAQLVNDLIRPALSENKIIICDRFIDSSVAYQGYGRLAGHKRVFDLCTYATGGITPDLSIFLDLDPKAAFDREVIVESSNLKGTIYKTETVKSRAADRIERSGMEFFQRVYEGYREWYKIAPYKSITIDARNNIMQIHHDIIENVWKGENAILRGI